MRTLTVLALTLTLASCTIEDRREPTSPSPIVVTPTPTPGNNTVPAPTINLFVAEPTRVFLGSTVVLRWDVTLPLGSVSGTPIAVRVDPAPGAVPATGVAIVQPFARGLYTAVLTAETTGGKTSRVVQVLVE